MPEYQELFYGNYFSFINNSRLNDQAKKGMTAMMKKLFNASLVLEILQDFEKWPEAKPVVFQNNKDAK